MRKLIRAGAVIAGAAAIVTLSAGTAHAATLGQNIAAKAKSQLTTDTNGDGVKDRGHVENGNNCNPYGPCQPWCADFAKWVWRKAGAKTTGLTAAAASFKTYGHNNGTFRDRTGTPKVGDAVMWDWDNNGTIDHVSIVVAVSRSSIATVGGNESNAVRYKTGLSRSNRDIVGYTSPKAR